MLVVFKNRKPIRDMSRMGIFHEVGNGKDTNTVKVLAEIYRATITSFLIFREMPQGSLRQGKKPLPDAGRRAIPL